MLTKKRCFAMFAGALALGVVGAQVHGAGMFTNGDFETGDFTGFTAAGAVAPGAVPYFGSGTTVLDGTTLATFNGGGNASGGTLSQTFGTAAGQLYSVTYFVGVTGGTNTQTLHTTVFGSDGTTTLASQDASANNPANATPLAPSTFTFTADGSQSTIQFLDALGNGGPSGQDLTLDNISISAVPEPVSSAVLGLGAFGLLARRRR